MKTIYSLSIVLVSSFALLASCSKKGTVTPPKTKVITVSTLAGSGTVGLVNGTGTAAEFDQASDLAISNGELYVADWLNNVVRKINLGGYYLCRYRRTRFSQWDLNHGGI